VFHRGGVAGATECGSLCVGLWCVKDCFELKRVRTVISYIGKWLAACVPATILIYMAHVLIFQFDVVIGSDRETKIGCACLDAMALGRCIARTVVIFALCGFYKMINSSLKLIGRISIRLHSRTE
jgi:hypothetical protein